MALRFVPAARVRHLFGRSASRNPETGRRRAESRRLYRQERYGGLARALLERPAAGSPPRARILAEPAVPARAGAWLAVSTNPSLIPFAGTPLSEPAELPGEARASLRTGPVYLRVFQASDGRPLETFVWEKP